jgi:hypothetical protein
MAWTIKSSTFAVRPRRERGEETENLMAASARAMQRLWAPAGSNATQYHLVSLPRASFLSRLPALSVCRCSRFRELALSRPHPVGEQKFCCSGGTIESLLRHQQLARNFNHLADLLTSAKGTNHNPVTTR